jgi:hypothetical protein
MGSDISCLVIIFNLAISELHYRCSFHYSELHKCYVNDQNSNSAETHSAALNI